MFQYRAEAQPVFYINLVGLHSFYHLPFTCSFLASRVKFEFSLALACYDFYINIIDNPSDIVISNMTTLESFYVSI